MVEWKPMMKNEYDELLADYFDRARLQRELHEFYKFTSFRRSMDLYENPMHTFEYEIIDKDHRKVDDDDINDTDDSFDNDWDMNDDYNVTPPRSPRHLKIRENHEESFETSQTLNTTIASGDDSAILEEGLSRASPNTHFSGVSYSSGNSSIPDLKIKKRQIERAFERRFPRYPMVLTLASSSSLRSFERDSFKKGKR
mmetsp:Transcript_1365/g.2480  ORF Transcript_1365/g.2480 Transcript_1365/m.2480 type:complete len:198 (+) Transcript_1365:201-794(+)